jgi:hypothetical protein
LKVSYARATAYSSLSDLSDAGHSFYDEPTKAQSWRIDSHVRAVGVSNSGFGTRINGKWSTGAWRS